MKEHLFGEFGEFIKSGEGICTKDWTFGITKGKGKLQLLKGKKVMWTAGVQNIDECKMQMGGAFTCKKKNGGGIWALNCGGKDGADMELRNNGKIILQMIKNTEKFKVNKFGSEVGNCDPKIW
eukprot:CAMPEP_0113577156 /NCGR_PEP_ID=MMETSP0015_2-20120614/28718_1 /TAXON_ID=2838 /ORGANISM="Odontella" /LENGTH=122 /DNA_ID=CAMNT_0000480717 /DNA_START=257 /DNA_END=625 /DNA_ORIENTATION=- /assembly_acc=CAM_ASM_000160